MKSIIWLVLLLLFNSCNAQKQNKTKDSLKYYNANQYKDWEKDPDYLSSYSEEDKFLMKGNERVRIWKDEKIHIEKSNKISPYTFYKTYSSGNKILLSEWIEFYRTFTGINRQYNENGKLIKEKDWDLPYPFSIEDLTKKFKKEYNVDIENRKNVRNVYRIERSKTLGIPTYQVVLKTEVGNKWVEYLVDGKTGKTLYIMKYSEGDDTDIFEEYLKSIGKFKGRT
jgi:hypothetical protein